MNPSLNRISDATTEKSSPAIARIVLLKQQNKKSKMKKFELNHRQAVMCRLIWQ